MSRYLIFLILPVLFVSCRNFREEGALVRAERAYLRKDYRRALLIYEKANKRKSPSSSSARFLYNRGTLYSRTGQRDKAESLWKEAARGGDPEVQAHIFFNRGRLLFQQRNYAAARQAFKKALLIRPSFSEAKQGLEQALEKERQERNLKRFFSSGKKSASRPPESSKERSLARLRSYLRKTKLPPPPIYEETEQLPPEQKNFKDW